MFKEIIEEKNKEKRKELMLKYIYNDNITEFIYYLKKNNEIELYNFFKNVESELIDLLESKEPFIMDITDDKFINITGESGSGKSTYVSKYLNTDDYFIVETDNVFNENAKDNEIINNIRKEIFETFDEEYIPGRNNLPINFRHFNDVLAIIEKNVKGLDKTIVIDSGQFRHLTDFNLLKGRIMIIRTSINESFNRACKRFLMRNPNATEDDLLDHNIKKYRAFELYKKFNTLIIRLYITYRY